jgi:hypothetical protein
VPLRYPLEPVSALRHARAEAQARALAERGARVEAARAEARAAEQRVESVRQAELELSRTEAERLGAGLCRADDLQRASDALKVLQDSERRLQAQSATAQSRLDAAKLEQERARGALAYAVAERNSVDRHRQSWDAARAQEREQQDEDAALERWSSAQIATSKR